jgi:hypothetical protein
MEAFFEMCWSNHETSAGTELLFSANPVIKTCFGCMAWIHKGSKKILGFDTLTISNELDIKIFCNNRFASCIKDIVEVISTVTE